MNRYFIYLSYKGTAYHGWQRQPNGISIQEVLEKALSVILRTDIQIVGAGRTDAGVHARLMAAHFNADLPIQESVLETKLNRMLPKDIAIYKIVRVKENAHARFDATARKYEYHLTQQKDSFLTETAAYITGNIDFDAMNKAAGKLLEYSDFTSFSKLHTDVKTNNCHINTAYWTQQNNCWVFTIEADRFLRNMVRAIVGTLLDVGRGKLSINDFCHIIEAKDRCKAGTSAPAEGLFLVDIKYPPTIFYDSENSVSTQSI